MSGLASTHLLLLLLSAASIFTTRAFYIVTTTQCYEPNFIGIRKYPTDIRATLLVIPHSCNATRLSFDDLNGLPNLSAIEANSQIERINTSIFISVPKLDKLRLNNNRLRELPVFEKHSCSSLASINLSVNKLSAINARTFSACTRLKYIDLSSNKIEYVDPDVFKPLADLKELRLDFNRLRFIPDSLLSRNDKLEELALRHNRITFLPFNFVTNLKSLKELNFEENPWHCACLLDLLVDIMRTCKIREPTTFNLFYVRENLPVCIYTSPAACCRHVPSGLQQQRKGDASKVY